MESQNTFESTITRAMEAAGVPKMYMGAEARPELVKGLYLYGKSGRGKTHMACGAIRAFVESHVREAAPDFWLYLGGRAMFVDAPSWFQELKSTYDTKGVSELDVMDRYATCGLLVLDDLGKGEKTAWVADRLYTLLNRRYNEQLPTIITSNYGLARLASILSSDEETKMAIASRVLGMCEGMEVTGEDRRRKNS